MMIALKHRGEKLLLAALVCLLSSCLLNELKAEPSEEITYLEKEPGVDDLHIDNPSFRHVYILDGKKVVEKIESQETMQFLYSSSVGKFIRPLLCSQWISNLYAWYQGSSLSASKVESFITKHNIKMEDFVVPEGGYTSFNEFFCRPLVPGARPIDLAPQSLVSPADSKCWVVPEVTTQATFFVKQQPFSLQTLLRDEAAAQYFEGGTLLLLRLAPYDYHRFHTPVAGMCAQPEHLGGSLESVHPVAFKAGKMPLLENKRDIIMIKSSELGCDVALIPVGAMFVGTIEYTKQLPAALSKGDELGYFAFGGSTIILLLPRGVVKIRPDLVEYTKRGFEVAVKVGEVLGTFVERKPL